MFASRRMRLLLFSTGSILIIPTMYLLVFLLRDQSWCFADTCINPTRALHTDLHVFYIFLASSIAFSISINGSKLLMRIFSTRILSASTVSIGEVAWFLSALATTFAIEIHNYNYWWNKRAAKWFAASKSPESLVFQTLYNSTGNCLSFWLGLVMLPTAKNSFLSTALNIPYTSLLRVHIWLGRTLFGLVALHLTSGIVMHLLLRRNLIVKLLTISHDSIWGDEDYQAVLGISAFAVLTVVVVTSLSYVRRKWYNTFYFTHFLVFIFIGLAYLHASSNILFLMPGLCLYTIDGLIRLSSRFSPDTVASVLVEKCGYITVTISTRKAAHSRPGHFMRVCFPSVSRFEFHPWSIVNATDTSVTFMFSPGSNFSEWSFKVAQLLQSQMLYESPPIKVCLQGPFGKPLEIRESQRAVVFHVGGTGIAAYIRAINLICANASGKSTEKTKSTRVFLFWTARCRNMSELSHLQALNSSNIVVELFETEITRNFQLKEAGGSDLTLGDGGSSWAISSKRPNLESLLDNHIRMLLNSEELGLQLFICGPKMFTKDSLISIGQFSKENKKVSAYVDVESFDV